MFGLWWRAWITNLRSYLRCGRTGYSGAPGCFFAAVVLHFAPSHCFTALSVALYSTCYTVNPLGNTQWWCSSFLVGEVKSTGVNRVWHGRWGNRPVGGEVKGREAARKCSTSTEKGEDTSSSSSSSSPLSLSPALFWGQGWCQDV